MPDVKSVFSKEKASLRAVKGPPRHPRHGGTFMSLNSRQPGNVTIMRNDPRKASLPALAPQKPRTKLMVNPFSPNNVNSRQHQLRVMYASSRKDFPKNCSHSGRWLIQKQF